jgi:hypothetical protein
MAKKILTAALKPENNLFHAIRESLVNNNALATFSGNESFDTFQSQMMGVAGTEGATLGKSLKVLTPGAYDAFMGAKGRSGVPGEALSLFGEAEAGLKSIQGLEGFSMQNFKGDQADLKAANMTLNAQSHLQTPAAEALFTTISVKYEDEGAEMVVRAAGLGTYAYGNSAWQSASELRPIFGLLRSGEMFKDEVLALWPVYPADAGDDTRSLFADAGLVAPTNATYSEGDAYGRSAHKTQFLTVPVTVPNLLGLTQVPGQRPWTSTDEIESNSISIRTMALGGKIGANAVTFFIDTKSMSNNTFGPTANGQSSDDRMLNMHLRILPGFSVEDKDGVKVGETIFASFKTAGYEPMLNVSASGNYQRQGNELRLNAGTAEVHALRDLTTGSLITIGKADDTQKALIRSFSLGTVVAMKPTFNVSNTSRGNFGYRIEVFDARKHLSVQRRSPVSVKYPISKDDVNQASLDFAIQQMSIVINNQCSRNAFDKAQDHLKYITSIDGSPVVGNNQGSNTLAGQHFVTASAVNRAITLKDVVSSIDSSGVFDAVCAAITNEISDITAALNTKSGLAAIAEYGGTDGNIEWTVVVHQNLSRFVMRSGDARTTGPKQSLNVVETNFDSQIGQILIVPKNTSTNDTINPLGGIGVNVSKENILVQGNVTRDQQDFGVVMTLPIYKHWALNPIIGSLTITDAHDFLGDEGLLSKLASQRVVVDNIGNAGANVPDTDPNA